MEDMANCVSAQVNSRWVEPASPPPADSATNTSGHWPAGAVSANTPPCVTREVREAFSQLLEPGRCSRPVATGGKASGGGLMRAGSALSRTALPAQARGHRRPSRLKVSISSESFGAQVAYVKPELLIHLEVMHG
jgi:hypothetical protein